MDVKTEPEEASMDVKTKPEEASMDVKTEPEEASMDVKTEPEEASRPRWEKMWTAAGPSTSGTTDSAAGPCCGLCGYQCAEQHLLDQHVRDNHGDGTGVELGSRRLTGVLTKPFRRKNRKPVLEVYHCDVCEYTSLNISSLRQHEASHKRKRFTCDICEIQFSCSCSLKSHYQIHSQKPYNCDYCGKMFKYKGAWVKHCRVHADGNSKPVNECDVCLKSFSKRKNLEEHRSTHTGERPLSCDVCKRTFNHRSALRTHEMMKHNFAFDSDDEAV